MGGAEAAGSNKYINTVCSNQFVSWTSMSQYKGLQVASQLRSLVKMIPNVLTCGLWN